MRSLFCLTICIAVLIPPCVIDADERPSPSKVPTTGTMNSQLASFDRMMIAFVRRHEVTSAALAVTDQGRLVFARGYGYADKTSQQPVQRTSLFRIASISKPITAVAVLQLVEQGRLDIDARVADILRWNDCADARLRLVTVRHLLQHRGGWDRDVSFDPMFQSVRFARERSVPPPAGPREIIRCMLDVPLDFEPGDRMAYSNFGYCLLGRIIEKVTGLGYEDYVRNEVLRPLGITSMRLGRTRLADRLPGEVSYDHPGTGPSVFAENLGEPVPKPYGAWCLEAMDAHGGWVASVVDLARFATAFDSPEDCPVLGPKMIRLMYERPSGAAGYEADGNAKVVYYSCGWNNRVVGKGKFNRWHTGSLPGTAAILVRRHDGRDWVVLLNSRTSTHSSRLSSTIDPLVHQAANAVTEWPETDLFPVPPNVRGSSPDISSDSAARRPSPSPGGVTRHDSILNVFQYASGRIDCFPCQATTFLRSRRNGRNIRAR